MARVKARARQNVASGHHTFEITQLMIRTARAMDRQPCPLCLAGWPRFDGTHEIPATYARIPVVEVYRCTAPSSIRGWSLIVTALRWLLPTTEQRPYTAQCNAAEAISGEKRSRGREKAKTAQIESVRVQEEMDRWDK